MTGYGWRALTGRLGTGLWLGPAPLFHQCLFGLTACRLKPFLERTVTVNNTGQASIADDSCHGRHIRHRFDSAGTAC